MIQFRRTLFFLMILLVSTLFANEADSSFDELLMRLLHKNRHSITYILNKGAWRSIELEKLQNRKNYSVESGLSINGNGDLVAALSGFFSYKEWQAKASGEISQLDSDNYSLSLMAPVLSSQRKYKENLQKVIAIEREEAQLEIESLLLGQCKEFLYDCVEVAHYEGQIETVEQILKKRRTIENFLRRLVSNGIIAKRSIDDVLYFFKDEKSELERLNLVLDLQLAEMSHKYALNADDMAKQIDAMMLFFSEIREDDFNAHLSTSGETSQRLVDSLRNSALQISNEMQTASVYSVGVGPTFTHRSGEKPQFGIGCTFNFGTKVTYNEVTYHSEYRSFEPTKDTLFSRIESYAITSNKSANLDKRRVNSLLADIRYGRRDAVYLLTRHLQRFVSQRDHMQDLISMRHRAVIESLGRLESTPFAEAWKSVVEAKR